MNGHVTGADRPKISLHQGSGRRAAAERRVRRDGVIPRAELRRIVAAMLD